MDFKTFSKLCDYCLKDLRETPKDVLAAALTVLISEDKEFRDEIKIALLALGIFINDRK